MIVIAVLVAGTFGILWTAPWKDDVEALNRDVADRLGDMFSIIGLRDENNTCGAATRPPTARERAAVDFIVTQLRTHPNARLANDGPGGPSVRDIAEQRAGDIGGCLAKVRVRGRGWEDLKRSLDEAIAVSR